MDIAGIDVLVHVARNLADQLPTDDLKAAFALPPLAQALVERGWLGEKSGQGFYKRQKSAGGSEILTLDPATMSYRAQQPPRLPALEASRSITDVAERTKTLFLGRDKVGAFLRQTLGSTLLYAARVAPDIAHSIDDVDRAMKWGFGWELGPFEIWDAIGIREVVDAVGVEAVPPLAAERLGLGSDRFRERRGAAGWTRAADPEVGQGSNPGRQAQRRGEPRGPRRRRAGRRVPLEDERDRRRYDPDAARRREGSGRELRGARRRQRGAAFLGRREPDAPAARGAGRQLGRNRHDGARVSGRDPGASLRRRAGRRRHGGPGDRRRLRDRAARPPGPGGGRDLHRPRRGRRRLDSRRRRHEGDAGAQRRGAARPSGGSAALHAARSSRRSGSRRCRRAPPTPGASASCATPTVSR